MEEELASLQQLNAGLQRDLARFQEREDLLEQARRSMPATRPFTASELRVLAGSPMHARSTRSVSLTTFPGTNYAAESTKDAHLRMLLQLCDNWMHRSGSVAGICMPQVKKAERKLPWLRFAEAQEKYKESRDHLQAAQKNLADVKAEAAQSAGPLKCVSCRQCAASFVCKTRR